MISEEKRNEYMDEITNICCDHNIDYDTGIVAQAIETSVFAKENINKLFNLTEDNDFRSIRTIRDHDLEKLLYRLEKKLAFLFADEWGWNIPVENFVFDWTDNKVTVKKQEMKISKLLNKVTSGEIGNNRTMVAEVDGSLESIYRYLNLSWCCINCVNVARLFEFIKNINFDFVISTNPVDIMTASYDCSFSSCYKPRGEYCNSVQSFLLDPYTAITFTTKHNTPSLKKMGRAWIHMLLPERVYELSKFYGTYPRILEKHMRSIFEDIADMDLIRSENSSIFSDGLHGIFIDNTGTTVFWDPDHPSNSDVSHKQVLPFAPVCFCCGDEHSNSQSWDCMECDGIMECYDCGSICHEDTMISNCDGNLVCENCLSNEYFFCDGCGDWYPHDFGSVDIGNGEKLCNNCFNDSEYRFCSNCDDIVDTSTQDYFFLSEYDAQPSPCVDFVCESCAGDYLQVCPECGDHVNKMDFDDSLDCCNFCVNEYYTPCEHCGDMVDKEETEKNGGYCDECYKTQREAI